MSRFLSILAATWVVAAMASTGWSQIVGGPQGFGGAQGAGGAQGFGGAQGMGGAQGFGPGHGMPSFSPVTGGSPMMGGGMGAQQQMAQIYMLYGMLGGRGNVSTGVANPFVNGGFGSLPYLDSQAPYDNSPAVRGSAAARKAEMRAQRAEQNRQAKLAKGKPAAKPARQKNVPLDE